MNKIRLMQPGDVKSVIQVHMNAFPGFFLTFLGPSFLKEFYNGICDDQSGITLVYDDQGVSGFVVGSAQPSGFYKRLLRKCWFYFGKASLGSLIRKPFILPRLLRAFVLSADTSDHKVSAGTLMSLAVLPNCQRQGIGKQLITSFLEKCREKQVKTVNLTTDAVGNDATNKFYLEMGFTLVKVFETPESRLMNEYIIQI